MFYYYVLLPILNWVMNTWLWFQFNSPEQRETEGETNDGNDNNQFVHLSEFQIPHLTRG